MSLQCPYCYRPYTFSARVQAEIPVCACLQDQFKAQALEDRQKDYLASVEQRVSALNLGPLQEHERRPLAPFPERNLIVVGPVGTGKTSLLKRITYNAALSGYKVRGGYVVELLSTLKDPEQIKPLMAWLESGNMLVLDDIDKSLGTQYELERLLLLVDRYWAQGLSVVSSMNMTPDELEKKLSSVRGQNLREEAKALLSRLKANARILQAEGPDRRQGDQP